MYFQFQTLPLTQPMFFGIYISQDVTKDNYVNAMLFKTKLRMRAKNLGLSLYICAPDVISYSQLINMLSVKTFHTSCREYICLL